MIIQCEKCKTRFRLDDSRISDAGVRVRCSRCSHTFIVKRDTPEEDSDFESILQGLGGGEPAETAAETASEAEAETEAETAAETDFLVAEDSFAADADEPVAFEGGEWDGEEQASFSVDDSFDNESIDDAPLSTGYDQDQEPAVAEFASVQEGHDREAETPLDSGESFRDFLVKGAGLPQFQVSSAAEPADDGPAAQTEEENADFSDQFDIHPAQENEGAVEAGAVEESGPVVTQPEADESDDVLEPAFAGEAERTISIREHLWPVADAKDEEVGEDELPPLSISSRRKSSSLIPVLIGILLLLALGGAGFYLFAGQGLDLAGLVPESVRSELGLGMKAAGPVEIRSLEGAFVANKDAGEIFVMRGDAFNVSLKPLTTIQVKGKIFGPKGEVLVQRTVFCGNVLSGQQLAFQPYSSMEKVMNRQFGETLANLDVPPGKGISFMIVFTAVPKGATDYAVEVVSPVEPVAP